MTKPPVSASRLPSQLSASSSFDLSQILSVEHRRLLQDLTPKTHSLVDHILYPLEIPILMVERISTKLSIPHPTTPGCSIVGMLEQLAPDQPTQGRKFALILHGTLGHKDYLFQRRLAVRLPLDSFRFDFRGNYETGGTWKQGALEEDIVDINVVVEYLQTTYGYAVDMVVGHSRGSIVAFRWLCTTEVGKNVTTFVNASGRYRMNKILDSAAGKVWKESFDKQGHHIWTVSVARQEVIAKVTPEDLEAFVNWDTSIVWDQFPPNIDVLTLHGLRDNTVPPYDALIYSRALGHRTPGTHTLHFMEDADHNFTGRQDEVVDTILGWLEARDRGEIRTGIWGTGFKGKL